MASGLLSGSFDKNRFAPDDWRHKDAKFQEPALSRNLAFVDALRPIAERRGGTVGHLAVAWTLRHPAVTAAIVGARTVAQAEQLLGGGEMQLTDADMAEIE